MGRTVFKVLKLTTEGATEGVRGKGFRGIVVRSLKNILDVQEQATFLKMNIVVCISEILNTITRGFVSKSGFIQKYLFTGFLYKVSLESILQNS